jgi:sensor domain CHASE-containing protein
VTIQKIKGVKMTVSFSVKYISLGLVIGCILTIIIGFNFGGWITGSKAAVLIEDASTAKVTESLLPLCVSRAKSDAGFEEKLIKLERAASYNRLELISSEDWAKMPGTNDVNRPLAIACALKLIEK